MQTKKCTFSTEVLKTDLRCDRGGKVREKAALLGINKKMEDPSIPAFINHRNGGINTNVTDLKRSSTKKVANSVSQTLFLLHLIQHFRTDNGIKFQMFSQEESYFQLLMEKFEVFCFQHYELTKVTFRNKMCNLSGYLSFLVTTYLPPQVHDPFTHSRVNNVRSSHAYIKKIISKIALQIKQNLQLKNKLSIKLVPDQIEKYKQICDYLNTQNPIIEQEILKYRNAGEEEQKNIYRRVMEYMATFLCLMYPKRIGGAENFSLFSYLLGSTVDTTEGPRYEFINCRHKNKEEATYNLLMHHHRIMELYMKMMRPNSPEEEEMISKFQDKDTTNEELNKLYNNDKGDTSREFFIRRSAPSTKETLNASYGNSFSGIIRQYQITHMKFHEKSTISNKTIRCIVEELNAYVASIDPNHNPAKVSKAVGHHPDVADSFYNKAMKQVETRETAVTIENLHNYITNNRFQQFLINKKIGIEETIPICNIIKEDLEPILKKTYFNDLLIEKSFEYQVFKYGKIEKYRIVSPQVRTHDTKKFSTEIRRVIAGEYLEKIIFPLFLEKAQHWALGFFDKESKSLDIYDSLAPAFIHELDIKVFEIKVGLMRHFGTNVKVSHQKCPRQQDSVSCGLHVIYVGEKLIMEEVIPTELPFSELDIYRKNLHKDLTEFYFDSVSPQ